jgi:MoxR-like ATPase
MRFTVRETPGSPRLWQRARHLIVVTSNHERDLPEAFLRRCVYVHLRFPDKVETLVEIVRRHLGGGGDGPLVEAAARRFLDVRKRLKDAQPEGVARLPGTSELIAWVKALKMLRRSANEASDAPLDARLGVSAILKHWEELAVFDAAATAR